MLPGVLSPDGGTPILERHLKVRKGETVLALEVMLATAAQTVHASLPDDGFRLEKGGVQLRAQCAYQEEFPVVAGNPMTALEEKLLRLTPQDLWGGGEDTGVPIALVRFVRYDENSLLDNVIPLSTSRYVSLPYLRERLRLCRSFYSERHSFISEAPRDRTESREEPRIPARGHMTTGVVTLNAGLHLQDGKILYSDEISHELGPGTVYVEFGVENVYPAVNSDRNLTDLLLGDVSLFTTVSGSYEKNLDRGVRLHPDKGTFELAVRMNSELRQSSLRLRWFAWRVEEKAVGEQAVGALLRLEPDVIYVAPGGVVSFVPVFANAAKAPCAFWIPDKQAGLITWDGVYTGPEKEGLYQVCAQIRDEPETKVNSFVIVRAAPEGPENGPGAV